MTNTRTKIVLLALALPALTGCSRGEACTKARMEAADAWKDVYEQSGKMKLAGGPSFDELDKNKQAQHTKEVGVVETQSEMVFKSFAYEKITWRTAAPARDKANETWQAFFNSAKYPSFAGSLKAANEQYDAVRTACGED